MRPTAPGKDQKPVALQAKACFCTAAAHVFCYAHLLWALSAPQTAAGTITREEHVRDVTEELAHSGRLRLVLAKADIYFPLHGIHELALTIFKGALKILMSYICSLLLCFSGKKMSFVHNSSVQLV